MDNVIVDFEFTGIDNEYIADNEIIQVKMINLGNRKKVIRNFRSRKPICAHGQISFGVERFNGHYFSKERFEKLLEKIGIKDYRNTNFCGFNIKLDKKMLYKYGIELPCYWDLKEAMLRSPYAHKLITEGNSLEVAYYLVTDKKPEFSHTDISELLAMVEIYDYVTKVELSEYMEFVPFGPHAGMRIEDYVVQYRRLADGYRFNNTDLYAESLNHYINILESYNEEDEDYYNIF